MISFFMGLTFLKRYPVIPSHEAHTKDKIFGKIHWPLALWLNRAGLSKHIKTKSELFFAKSRNLLLNICECLQRVASFILLGCALWVDKDSKEVFLDLANE